MSVHAGDPRGCSGESAGFSSPRARGESDAKSRKRGGGRRGSARRMSGLLPSSSGGERRRNGARWRRLDTLELLSRDLFPGSIVQRSEKGSCCPHSLQIRTITPVDEWIPGTSPGMTPVQFSVVKRLQLVGPSRPSRCAICDRTAAETGHTQCRRLGPPLSLSAAQFFGASRPSE